jgi:hypothetical protein
MDTLGTIHPQMSSGVEISPRIEVIERLRYLCQTGNRGVLAGESGTGKSCLLAELSSELSHEGLSASIIDLTGVTKDEIPYLLGTRLGCGMPPQADPLELWTWLQECGEASGSSHRKLVFLIDHLDQADPEVQFPLGRLVQTFAGSAAWVFAVRSPIRQPWLSFLNDRAWLKVQLGALQPNETLQFLTRDLLERDQHVQITPDGGEAAHVLAAGRLRRLRQLAELASVAIEADHLQQLDAELIQAIALELPD